MSRGFRRGKKKVFDHLLNIEGKYQWGPTARGEVRKNKSGRRSIDRMEKKKLKTNRRKP